jgi:hypothetical protein
MEVQSNIFLKKQAEAEMLKLENTIDKLTNINKSGKPPREIDTRIRFLLTKVVSVEKTIEEYDANIKAAKEAISKGWIPEQ